MDFCVANAFQAAEYEKYSKGGNFTMTFAGLGDYLECMNDKGVVRFYEGNPVEEERARKNDPTIDHRAAQRGSSRRSAQAIATTIRNLL